jgi:hypothetical protein
MPTSNWQLVTRNLLLSSSQPVQYGHVIMCDVVAVVLSAVLQRHNPKATFPHSRPGVDLVSEAPDRPRRVES